MQYFVPVLEETEQFSAEAAFQEKLGGTAFGLTAEKYPICRNCGRPMALLAQLEHDAERLNLGREGRVLFVFQCSNRDYRVGCATWDADSGANACFVVEPEDLTGNTEEIPGERIETEKEFYITDWRVQEDEISEAETVYFLDVESYENIDDETSEDLFEKASSSTKLGSVPYWIQYPDIPEGEWSFVGQLDDDTEFNFGDAGIGYIFIELIKENQLPKAKFFWQCG